MSERDTIFGEDFQQARDFVFDERVVRVFPDMIRRSVPGYGLIVPSLALMAMRFVQPGSRIYDLGCSLGAVSFAIREAIGEMDTRIIAVDKSREMIDGLRKNLDDPSISGDRSAAVPIETVEADVLETEVKDASVVVLNFTLQFIDPDERLSLLRRIANGIRSRGALLLSEKIRFENEREEALQSGWHIDFKRAQGYSDLEIARKREALENTLKPDTVAEHLARLQSAGFGEAYTWFQCFNFASICAIR